MPNYGDATFRATSIRELLLMRGGVLFKRDDPFFFGETKDMEAAIFNPFGPMARLHYLGLDEIRASLSARKFGQQPFSYQNVNTAILAAMLVKLYGRPVEDLLSEKLWHPAGAKRLFDTIVWLLHQTLRRPNRTNPLSIPAVCPCHRQMDYPRSPGRSRWDESV